MFKTGDKVEILIDRPCDAELMKGDVTTVTRGDSLGVIVKDGWALCNHQIRMAPEILTSNIDIGGEILVREVRYG